MSEPYRHHEPDAAAGRGLMIILLATLPAIALVSFGLWLGFRSITEPVPPSAFEAPVLTGQQPAKEEARRAPALQSDPPADLNDYNRRMQDRLNSAGWLDEDAGTVHMPIDRAMDLMVERGLPEEEPP